MSRLLLEEAARRAQLKAQSRTKQNALLGELFKEQQAFARDPARRKAVLGSRRAGKTEMWSRLAVSEALSHGRCLVRLWGPSRLRAKDLLWAGIGYLCKRNGIPVKENATELSFEFENGSVIRLVGASQDKDVQRKRGDKTQLEVVLECQSFAGYLQTLVEDVIEPSLLDNQGTVCLEGTPGPVCAGFWYDVTGEAGSEAQWYATRGGWSCHQWTMLQNPFIPHARAYLTQLKKEKKWADDNPTYLREWCGRWTNDTSALYYSFDATRNTYSPDKVQPYGHGWMHSLGWDLGFRDSMALAIIGWNPTFDDNIYEVFSWKKAEVKAASVVMDEIDRVERNLGLRLVSQVADTGGGGKMYVEEVMNRFGRKFEPASKTNKYEHVRLMNEDLLSGRLKLIPGSPWALEIAALMKDTDTIEDGSPPKEDPRCDNHAADAGIYSFRAAYSHTHTPTKRIPKPGTADWIDEMVLKSVDSRAKGWSEQLDSAEAYDAD